MEGSRDEDYVCLSLLSAVWVVCGLQEDALQEPTTSTLAEGARMIAK